MDASTGRVKSGIEASLPSPEQKKAATEVAAHLLRERSEYQTRSYLDMDFLNIRSSFSVFALQQLCAPAEA